MGRRAWAIGMVAGALAACGGADDPANPKADEEFITAALLTQDDLPNEFREEPVDDEASTSAVDECASVLGLDPDEIEDAKTAETAPVQFQSETLSVRAYITAFESDDLPQQLLTGFGDDDDFRSCYQEQFAAELGDDATLESLTVDTLPIDEDTVDAGTTLLFEFDLAGTAAEARAELALVDRFAISMQTSALSGDMDVEVAATALEAMVRRLGER